MQDIFDVSGDDRWYYDREDAPWAANDAEVEQLWKQSVRNHWLRLKLAGKDPDGIRKTLDKRYDNLGKTLQQLDATDAFVSFLHAYTTPSHPHTDYVVPSSAERFTHSLSLPDSKLYGVGQGDVTAGGVRVGSSI